jgi:hypothetical protein
LHCNWNSLNAQNMPTHILSKICFVTK